MNDHDPEAVHPIPFLLQWLIWPVALLGSVTATVLAPRWGIDPVAVSGGASGLLILVLVLFERIWPADPAWKMTWRSFFRDIQFFVVSGLSIGATNTIFGYIGAVTTAGHIGPLTSWPLWITVPIGIFVVDFVQYWEHRVAHESGGPLGKLMWRAHAAHHLPEQIYVLMHPAQHPIYVFLVTGLATILPLYLLGLTPQAVVLVTLVAGIQGIISLSNLDLRAGWFNYIFVGPELHRYHHSADLKEAQNYAVVLSLIDVLFGTFVYKPGRLPERIGVADAAAYPRSVEVWKIMLLPFLPWIGRRSSR